MEQRVFGESRTHCNTGEPCLCDLHFGLHWSAEGSSGSTSQSGELCVVHREGAEALGRHRWLAVRIGIDSGIGSWQHVYLSGADLGWMSALVPLSSCDRYTPDCTLSGPLPDRRAK